jgi:hypothetical protein
MPDPERSRVIRQSQTALMCRIQNYVSTLFVCGPLHPRHAAWCSAPGGTAGQQRMHRLQAVTKQNADQFSRNSCTRSHRIFETSIDVPRCWVLHVHCQLCA